ncbi:MAG: hypothetical protein IJ551_03240, partial [Prevotella sp.]|nr:hypothetical protein [Prevotella sp.]
MRKNIFKLWMLAAVMLPGLASCTVNDNPVDNDQVTTDVDPTSVNEFKPEVLVAIAPLWVASDVDADLTQAFNWATAIHETAQGAAGIYVVNKL